jgi:hypothetical protein
MTGEESRGIIVFLHYYLSYQSKMANTESRNKNQWQRRKHVFSDGNEGIVIVFNGNEGIISSIYALTLA